MRNMAVGTISAWWITLTTLLTYALKDLETESSTGLLSTILGYVRLKKNGSFTVCSCNVIQYAVSGSDCQCLVIKSIAVEGYETGEHAPGLKLKGTGAYKAAHHIIKVGLNDLCPVLLINLIIYHNFQLLVLILWLQTWKTKVLQISCCQDYNSINFTKRRPESAVVRWNQN